MAENITNFFHLLATSVWIGGAMFIHVVLQPSLRRIDPRESGMLTVWVGWDAISDESLMAYKADGKVGVDRERAVQTLRDHGIDVSLFYMLGSREDSLDDFKRAVEVADRLGVSMHPSLVVPYPGTELRQQYEPYLYKELGWEYYTGAYALFDHPDAAMTPEAREEAFYESSLELLSLPRVLRHMFKVPLSGFPYAHILSLMNQLPVRKGVVLEGLTLPARPPQLCQGCPHRAASSTSPAGWVLETATRRTEAGSRPAFTAAPAIRSLISFRLAAICTRNSKSQISNPKQFS